MLILLPRQKKKCLFNSLWLYFYILNKSSLEFWCLVAFYQKTWETQHRCIWTKFLEFSSLFTLFTRRARQLIPVYSCPLLLILAICHCSLTAPHWFSWSAQPGGWWRVPCESCLRHFFSPTVFTGNNVVVFFPSTLPSVQPLSLRLLDFGVRQSADPGSRGRRGRVHCVTEQNHKPLFISFCVFVLKMPWGKKKTKSRPMGVADERQDIIKWIMGN